MKLSPFRAIRPRPRYAREVSIPPYDVLSDQRAREFGKKKNSLIHVTRSEVNFPEGVNPYTSEVYENAKETLEKMMEDVLFLDDPGCYVYTEILHGRSQRGLVALVDGKDAKGGKVKVHELTLKEKQKDRTDHFHALEVQDEPVFLFHEKVPEISGLLEEVAKGEALYDFVDEAGVNHILHKVPQERMEDLSKAYDGLEALYIADGHHRTASAIAVGELLPQYQPGLMAVIFPEEELQILGYHRLLKDLGGHTEEEFLSLLSRRFTLEPLEKVCLPPEKHTFVFRFKEGAYLVTPKVIPQGVVESLDVSILQNLVIEPILGIEDIRKSDRIDFYGGFTSMEETEEKLKEDWALAIYVHPVTGSDIRKVSDGGFIMPPKSTWFEPKLRSGLFLYPYKQ